MNGYYNSLKLYPNKWNTCENSNAIVFLIASSKPCKYRKIVYPMKQKQVLWIKSL